MVSLPIESSTALWATLIVVVLIYYYRKIRKMQSYWEERGVKHIKPWFLIGSISLYPFKNIAYYFCDLYNQFPEERYHGLYMFHRPSLMLKDPDLIKQIGIKEFDSFMNHRSFMPPDIDPMWNKNLFATNDQEWRDMRTTLSPAFTGNKMKLMFPLMNSCAQQFVTYFENHDNEAAELEMKDVFTRYTNDVIATTAFGITVDSLKDKTNDFYMMGRRATDFKGIKSARFMLGVISPFLCKLFGVKIIETPVANYFTDIIREAVRIREEQQIVRPDMIQLLMEAQKERSQHQHEELDDIDETEATKSGKKRQITVDDIAAQAFVFFLAGFDTAANLISFTFYELAANPDVQTKLREEIAKIKEVTYEAIQGVKYLEMVLSETLRKWPPTIMTDRLVTKPFTIQPVRPGEKPLDLEVGTVVWFPQFPMQRDPKHYPDPNRFDPERFNDENKRKRDPATYIPFGIGPRLCIGSRFALLEAKMLLYHVVKNFEIVPISRTQIPLALDEQFYMAAKGGIWLGFKKIQETSSN